MPFRTLITSLTFFAAALCTVLALDSQASDAQEKPAPAAGKTEATKPAAPEAEDVGVVVAKIDEALSAAWEKRGVKPSEQASDDEWLRRIYIDTIGRAPTREEATAFYASDLKNKRELKIDALLASEDHAKHMGEFWLKAISGFNIGTRRQGVQQLYGYLIDVMAENKPYDEWVTEILTATGELELIRANQINREASRRRNQREGMTDPMGELTERLRENGSPLGFMIAFGQENANLTGNVSRALLGIEIQCAQCHDHMTEHWKQKEFQQLAASFRSTSARPKSREEQYIYVVNDSRDFTITEAQFEAFMKRRAERRARANGTEPVEIDTATLEEQRGLRTAVPTALDGTKIEGKTGLELRKSLAEWITAEENELFSRTAVNRMWGHYLKRGFVDPVDDFNSITEEFNEFPELLEYLAKDFADSGFDLRRLQKIILSSRAYNLSSKHNKTNENDLTMYSRAYITQLSATEVFDSLMAATGVLNSSDVRERLAVIKARIELVRSVSTESDDDESRTTESFTGTIPQALEMMNGPLDPSASKGSTLGDILRDESDADARLTQMYLAALSREPSKKELKDMGKYIKEEGGVVAAYEDVFWALLNSAEFMTNH